MFIGIALISCWIWFLSNYQDLTIRVIKEILLVFGVGIILMSIELIWEIKTGFKLLFKGLVKLIVLPIKTFANKSSIKRIERKINNGLPLTKREISKWKEHGELK